MQINTKKIPKKSNKITKKKILQKNVYFELNDIFPKRTFYKFLIVFLYYLNISSINVEITPSDYK